MTEYIYYWYHHMMPSKERKVIQKALDEKDYFGFIDLYKKYTIQAIEYGTYYDEFKCWIPMTFLPNHIVVWENDEIIEKISILDKENFDKITFSECECG